LTTVQVEPWSAMVEEAKQLFPLHWREIAVHQETIPMDMDEARYLALEAGGMLHVVTVRSGNRLVGYCIAFVLPHMHYKTTLMGMVDMYFILPEFRRGAGARLFLELERSLKARGVVKAISSCKVHQDHTALFEALGWKWTDKTFCKVIGA
jgi:hypothetical protein